ncbi:hypothetical protein ACP70R_022841 [Stipagrostis hirtigluma subsp. patula]
MCLRALFEGPAGYALRDISAAKVEDSAPLARRPTRPRWRYVQS